MYTIAALDVATGGPRLLNGTGAIIKATFGRGSTCTHSDRRSIMSREVLRTIIELATAAFGLVAALAWNAAIQALFEAVLPQAGDLVAKFAYAIVVTIIAVVVIMRLGRLAERMGLGEDRS